MVSLLGDVVVERLNDKKEENEVQGPCCSLKQRLDLDPCTTSITLRVTDKSDGPVDRKSCSVRVWVRELRVRDLI